MCRTIQLNYKNDKAFAANGWACVACGAPDSQDHLVHLCPGYVDLRQDLDLDTDLGMIQFFRAVIKRREG